MVRIFTIVVCFITIMDIYSAILAVILDSFFKDDHDDRHGLALAIGLQNGERKSQDRGCKNFSTRLCPHPELKSTDGFKK